VFPAIDVSECTQEDSINNRGAQMLAVSGYPGDWFLHLFFLTVCSWHTFSLFRAMLISMLQKPFQLSRKAAMFTGKHAREIPAGFRYN
jgi:hypothetical protein